MRMVCLGDDRELGDPLVERRGAVRYELEVPVVFFWTGPQGSKVKADGVTRDISEVGLYVHSENCPPPKTKVLVEIVLTEPRTASALLKGSMQVMRVEDGRAKVGSCGFALAGKTLSLSNAARV